MKNKKSIIQWFTLIEIVIATTILTISVFWVYNLIWENTKIISNFDNFKQWESLFSSLEQCIDYIWFDYFKSSTNTGYNFNFWNDNNWCLTWTINKITLDNTDYELRWNITNSGSNFIDWELWVYSENTNEITKKFTLLKK